MAGNKIKGITIEIGGNTTPLSKAIEGANKTTRSLQVELRQVDKLLKLDPTNVNLLSQRQKILASSISETKTKLDTLKEAEKQVQKQFERGDVSEEQYRALQREVIKTEQELKALKEAADNSTSALDKVSETTKKIGKSSEALGKKLTVISGAAAAGLGGGIALASQFEDAFAKVLTIADTTETSAEDLEKAIKNLSDETGIAATDIADNVYNAISAGQKTGDAVNFVSNAAKLAKAGFTDGASALDILTTAMNAYGLKASEVNKVSDLLIGTQNLGKTTVAELSSAMGKVIPTAKANNVELNQLCTGYAILTANGIATAESTTYMNAMLNELGKGGTNVDKILREKTGASFSELSQQGSTLGDVLQILNNYATENNKSFGDLWSSSEAGKAGLVLLGEGADTFNLKLKEMNAQTGATETAFNKLDTNSNKAKIAINQLKNILTELGESALSSLQPIIEQVVNKIKSFSEGFSNLSDGSKNTITAILALVAALGPALIAFGKMATGVSSAISAMQKIGTVIPIVKTALSSFNIVQTAQAAITKVVAAAQGMLNAVMTANPIGLIVVAIAGLVAAFVLLWNKCEGFRNFFIGLWEAIKGIVNTWAGFFSGVWDSIKAVFASVGSWFSDTFSAAWTAVKNVFSSWGSFFSGLWEKIKSTFSSLGTSIANAIGNAVKSGINGVISMIEGRINSAIKLINGAIGLVNKIPGVKVGTIKTLSLPRLATGTVLTKATPVIAGEDGAEAIMPLEKHTEWIDVLANRLNVAMNGASGGTRHSMQEIINNLGGINFNIDKFENNSDKDLHQIIGEAMEVAEEYIKRRGGAFA